MGSLFQDNEPLKFDGQGAAYTIEGSELLVLDIETGNIAKRISLSPPDGKALTDISFSISPDSKRIAIDSRSTAKTGIYNTESGKLVQLIDHGVPVARVVRFSPAGNQIWLGAQSHAERWDITTGKKVEELGNREVGIDTGNLIVGADGTTIALVNRGNLQIWKSGQPLPAQTAPIRATFPVANYQGKLVSFVTTEGMIEVWNLLSASRIAQAPEGESQTVSMSFSTDGKSLQLLASDGRYRSWDISSAPGPARKIADEGGGSFTPDGRYFIGREYPRKYHVWRLDRNASLALHPRAGNFDLGGPCLLPGDSELESLSNTEVSGERLAAENAGDWNRLLNFEKASVRLNCEIRYRWLSLAEVLLRLGRNQDAIEVLKDAHSRGDLDMHDPGLVGKFLRSVEFRKSEFGVRFWKPFETAQVRNRRFIEALKKLPARKGPPDIYVAKNACPFECCTFREWTVKTSVDLLDKPNGNTIVTRLSPGQKVSGVTGEVHVKPRPAGVVYPTTLGSLSFEEGDIFFVLDFRGEAYRIWANGKVLAESIDEPSRACAKPSKGCWAQWILEDSKAPEDQAIWWVKIRTKDGKSGWTKGSGSFGNQDACAL